MTRLRLMTRRSFIMVYKTFMLLMEEAEIPSQDIAQAVKTDGKRFYLTEEEAGKL